VARKIGLRGQEGNLSKNDFKYLSLKQEVEQNKVKEQQKA